MELVQRRPHGGLAHKGSAASERANARESKRAAQKVEDAKKAEEILNKAASDLKESLARETSCLRVALWI